MGGHVVHGQNIGIYAFLLGLYRTAMGPKRKEGDTQFCLPSNLPFLQDGHFC